MMLSTVAYGGMTAAWRQPQQLLNAAAHSAETASVSTNEKETAAPVAAAVGASAASAPKTLRSGLEMPYIPNGFGPEDLATRTRAKFPNLGSSVDPDDEWVKRLGSPFGDDAAEPFRMLGSPEAEQKEAGQFHFLGEKDEDGDKTGVEEVKDKKSPADVMNEEKCETCAKRKYQDGSDDPGVSFKFATRVDPKAAQAKVRGHELEHVVRERAKAKMEGRKVVSQSVTYHTGICPECGKFYIAGGTTRTVTAADNTKDILSKLQKERDGGADFDISA